MICLGKVTLPKRFMPQMFSIRAAEVLPIVRRPTNMLGEQNEQVGTTEHCVFYRHKNKWSDCPEQNWATALSLHFDSQIWAWAPLLWRPQGETICTDMLFLPRHHQIWDISQVQKKHAKKKISMKNLGAPRPPPPQNSLCRPFRCILHGKRGT